MVVLCVCACGGAMGRTLQAMLITHKWPKPVVTAIINVLSHSLVSSPWMHSSSNGQQLVFRFPGGQLMLV